MSANGNSSVCPYGLPFLACLKGANRQSESCSASARRVFSAAPRLNSRVELACIHLRRELRGACCPGVGFLRRNEVSMV